MTGPGHRYRLLSSLHRHHGSLTVNTPSKESGYSPGHLVIGTQKTFSRLRESILENIPDRADVAELSIGYMMEEGWGL